MPCYVLQAGDTDMVKLGWAGRGVESRRRALQTAHWLPLTMLRAIDGPRAVEGWMQRRFAHLKVSREWHRFHPDMLTVEPPSGVTETVHTERAPDPTLDAVEEFLRSTGMTATAFGRLAVGDPALVRDMRKGRECKLAVRSRITAFITSRKQSAA